MAHSEKVVSPADISAKEFENLLGRYPSLLQSVSDGKAGKSDLHRGVLLSEGSEHWDL